MTVSNPTARRVRVRPTDHSDLGALAALFEDRFGHPVTPEEWEWKYRRVPGEARSWVAVDETGRVLAHAGALCLPARLGAGPAEHAGEAPEVGEGREGSEFREAGIWQLTDWAGTASVTGLRPPLVGLGRRLLADLPRPEDAPWIFGFPSERHFDLGRRVFGYRSLPGVVELAGALPGAGSTLEAVDPGLIEVHEHCGAWPEAAEAAWAACRVRGVRRSAAFLNWRYHARPGRYYRFYRLRAAGAEDRDAPGGLAVFAFAGVEALAAELWLPPPGSALDGGPTSGPAPKSEPRDDRAAEVWLPALRAVAADLMAAGLSRWRFWPPPAGAAALERLGVRATGPAVFMGSRGRAGDQAGAHPADPCFYYAMGDYDLI